VRTEQGQVYHNPARFIVESIVAPVAVVMLAMSVGTSKIATNQTAENIDPYHIVIASCPTEFTATASTLPLTAAAVVPVGPPVPEIRSVADTA
jgi:hypothetical protein